jgi:UDP-N-acetyl-D-glucosamine dehydrogenase
MIGVAYKRDVDDTRESPAIDIMRLLQDRGADVHYADPFVAHLTAAHGLHADQDAVAGLPGICADYDCVVVGTDHSDIDWPAVIAAAPLMVDTRNVASGSVAPNVVRI